MKNFLQKNKEKILILLVVILCSSIINLFIYSVMSKRQPKNEMENYYKSEFKRLEDKSILMELEIIQTQEAIKKMDSSFVLTELNLEQRNDKRKKMSDSLIIMEWTKFGF